MLILPANIVMYANMFLLTHSTLRTHPSKTSVGFTPVFKSFGGLRRGRASECDGEVGNVIFRTVIYIEIIDVQSDPTP
jgi:hypothetical protein